MSLIKDRKNKIFSSGSYERIFNNKDLGKLITLIQSTSISNGCELEKIIFNSIEKDNLATENDLKKLLNKEKLYYKNFLLITKKIFKKNTITKITPDFLMLIAKKDKLYIVELKDGSVFDTKKVKGELFHLETLKDILDKNTSYVSKILFCCFNAKDINEIYGGTKKILNEKYLITGKELCKILNINYEIIIKKRLVEAEQNLNFFIDELLNIKEIKNIIIKKLQKTTNN